MSNQTSAPASAAGAPGGSGSGPMPTFRRPWDGAGLLQGITRLVRDAFARQAPDLPCKVVAVYPGKDLASGTVDVEPMVHQQDALGQGVPHGVLHNVPYYRVAGGGSAIVIEPCVGDIGHVTLAGRDISNLKASRKAGPPASYRIRDMSDGIYVASIMALSPQHYIQATGQGWRIVTPGVVEVSAAQVKANCDIVTSGDVVASGVSLKGHTHGGVKAGPDSTGKPT
ncbi:baseplate assembly protein [Formicincola oecophyllae]|uniref:Baseplate assembly protein n=1 Tax=Formicincola oecophyllae TaxID=2558361 RepID=A0A4Y6UCC1_9PROT|nr:Gp138 family membrane-puncturing spike protein [Formicincola oecophyllae]QDH14136.1 baseplate assembly protein [Formicincola oecophyllae]